MRIEGSLPSDFRGLLFTSELIEQKIEFPHMIFEGFEMGSHLITKSPPNSNQADQINKIAGFLYRSDRE